MIRLATLPALVALVAVLAWPGAPSAGTLGDGDQAAVRALIGSQIAAFQDDDGDAAYGMASPSIQKIFPSVGAFMAMVRQGYQPVYRPRSVAFGAVVETAAGPIQKVYLTGPDGLGYLAAYSPERQPDGSWKISGCSIVRDDRPSI